MTSKKVWRDRAKRARRAYLAVHEMAWIVASELEDSREITRAVHDTLETVEAPPAESLAGRVLALHEVLENQRRADAATANDLLVQSDAKATAERQRADQLAKALRAVRFALDAVGAPEQWADTADRVRALARQLDNWKRDATGAVATREERDRLKAKVAELADLANTRQATIQRQAEAAIAADELLDARADTIRTQDQVIETMGAKLAEYEQDHKGGGSAPRPPVGSGSIARSQIQAERPISGRDYT